jgi:hypothetical protein
MHCDRYEPQTPVVVESIAGDHPDQDSITVVRYSYFVEDSGGPRDVTLSRVA